MKKVLIHVLTLAVVFVLAVFGFSRFLNKGITETTEMMANATFPLVYMTNGGSRLNCLHGYNSEMDVTAMRDTLTPLEDNRTLHIEIQPYQNKINNITYEIISSDGTKSLEKTKVNKIEEKDSYVKATLQMQDSLLINTEYILKLQVTAGSKDIYYYTRVIYEDGLHTKAYLDFANGFYERCLNKNDLDSLSAYIEPNAEGDNTNFAFMDIHSSMDQLSWAGLTPTAYYKPVPSIKEINATTATVVMDYMISARNEQEETELYAVSEYYRMLYSEERIRLLDFERTTNEIFNPEKSNVILSSGINLGVTDRAIEYSNDRNNRYFAFVQQGALWLYRVSGHEMVQVFRFMQEENSDARDTYAQNDIQIVDIDSDGNMYFLVCGYMNRGDHEGTSGVAVYYFNHLDYSITELLFVETKQNYELLMKDVQELNYISKDRKYFYVCIDRNIYGIHLDSLQTEVLVSDIQEDCSASSRSGRLFAWTTGTDRYHAETLEFLNLDTRQRRQITCDANERLYLVGFLEEDLVYGIADTVDINVTQPGLEFFPMKKILIVNEAGEIVKEYTPTGYYITEAVIEAKMLTMSRMQKTENGFVEALADHIVNSTEDELNNFGLTTRVTSRKQTEMVLKVGTTLTSGSVPQIIRSREAIQENTRTVRLDSGTRQEVYYVYAKGRLFDVCTSIGEAVKTANQELGVVVDNHLQNIWERGNKVAKRRLDVSTFPSVIHQGRMDVDAIANGTGCKALDLSGCTLDSVLYYVSEGTPVLVKVPVSEQMPHGIVIIAGYDEYNTILLNPGEEETFYYGIKDSTALFEGAGNYFMTYWDPITD